MYRKTYANIYLNNIKDNVNKIIEKYNDYKYYIGVVKNNAYGHGIESIKYMIKGGINYLAVSSLEEALKVRELDKKIPVLILEPITLDGINIAKENNLTITIDNKEYFNKLLNNKIKIKFHLKIDSGMNRFGLKDKNELYKFDLVRVSLDGPTPELHEYSGHASRKAEADRSRIPAVHNGCPGNGPHNLPVHRGNTHDPSYSLLPWQGL